MGLGPGSPFNLVSAVGEPDGASVLLTFTNPVDVTNAALFSPTSYAITGGISVIGATLSGTSAVLLATSAQTSGASYSVTVSQALTDIFNQTLGAHYASWLGAPSYVAPYLVSDLTARTDCRGLAIYLDWMNPTSAPTQPLLIVRRTRSWPFDLTDAYDTVYSGSNITTFLDTGVKAPITTLTAPVTAGSTSVTVVSNAGYSAGMLMKLETLTGMANTEVVKVLSTSGSYTVTFTTATVNAYSSGDRVAQSSPLQPQTYYYYLVLVSQTPGQYTIDDASRAFALSIDQFNSVNWFTNNTPRVALALDATDTSNGGGGGFLNKLYQMAGCWLNLMRGHTLAVQLLNNDDAAPFNTLAAKNISLGIQPEGFSYDFSIVRRALLSLVYVYKRKGACPGIIETVRMFTLWDATCQEFGIGGCDDGPVPLQTYDGQSQLYTSGSLIPGTTAYYSTGSFEETYGLTHPSAEPTNQWLGGTFWGSIGDIACISGSSGTTTETTYTFVAPTVVATVGPAGAPAATSTVPLTTTVGLIPYLQVEVGNAAGTVSEIHEILSVSPGVSITLRDPLQNSYVSGDFVSITKNNTRQEYLGIATSSAARTLTDSNASWEQNQWNNFYVMSSGAVVAQIASNTPTTLTLTTSVTLATGEYSIARAFFGSAASFAARVPETVYQVGTGTITRTYEPRYDLREFGTKQDPFNVLYGGPGISTAGGWGPNDIGVYITTPVTVINGKGIGAGNVLTLDPSQPAPVAGSLVGMYLNPNQNQEQLFLILANTTTTVTVGSSIASLVNPTQYYYVLKQRDANRFTRLSDRLRTGFVDTDINPHVLFF